MLENKKNVSDLKLDKNEKGYALFESLIGLALLSIVSLSLIVALPALIEKQVRLDEEQAIYYQLFELHNGGSPDINAFRNGHKWCTIYVRSDGHEHEICL